MLRTLSLLAACILAIFALALLASSVLLANTGLLVLAGIPFSVLLVVRSVGSLENILQNGEHFIVDNSITIYNTDEIDTDISPVIATENTRKQIAQNETV